jgi:hypothetical protein
VKTIRTGLAAYNIDFIINWDRSTSCRRARSLGGYDLRSVDVHVSMTRWLSHNFFG